MRSQKLIREGVLSAYFSFSTLVRKVKTTILSKQSKNAFPSWAVLGLISTSIGISLLEVRADWPWISRFWIAPALMQTPATYLLFGLSAIITYVVLTLWQPLLLPWPKYRLLSLAIIFFVMLIAPFFVLSIPRLAIYMCVYGIVAYTYAMYGRNGSLLVGGTAASGFCITFLLTHIFSIGMEPINTPTQFLIWLIGLAFVHSFMGLGIRERSERLRNEELVKALTAAQEQLSAYALNAEELAIMRERARLAREIHDTLAQGLAAIKMNLDTATAVYGKHPEQACQYVERAQQLASEHLSETRHSLLELRTDAFAGQSLPQALSTLVETWSTRNSACPGGATFLLRGLPNDICLPMAVELAYYRIGQEALNNIAKHSQAFHVDVELSREANELCLTITDDGVGFEPTQLSSPTRSNSFGIIGMQERMRLLNGRLEIISTPGVGTQVVAMLPFNEADSLYYREAV